MGSKIQTGSSCLNNKHFNNCATYPDNQIPGFSGWKRFGICSGLRVSTKLSELYLSGKGVTYHTQGPGFHPQHQIFGWEGG